MTSASFHRELLVHRRKALGTLAALVACGSGPARAATWPERPINLVVPFAAGGGTDTVARLIGQKLQAALGGTVVCCSRRPTGTC